MRGGIGRFGYGLAASLGMAMASAMGGRPLVAADFAGPEPVFTRVWLRKPFDVADFVKVSRRRRRRLRGALKEQAVGLLHGRNGRRG